MLVRGIWLNQTSLNLIMGVIQLMQLAGISFNEHCVSTPTHQKKTPFALQTFMTNKSDSTGFCVLNVFREQQVSVVPRGLLLIVCVYKILPNIKWGIFIIPCFWYLKRTLSREGTGCPTAFLHPLLL